MSRREPLTLCLGIPHHSLIDRPNGLVLPFDRHSSPSPSDHSAIFYLDPTSSSSGQLLGYLSEYSSSYPTFGFTVRYKPSKNRKSGTRTSLSGWGVELALKNTDYLVVDDRASSSPVHKADAGVKGSTSGDFFSEVLGDDPWSEHSTPLSKDELKGEHEGSRCRCEQKLMPDIGLKAASLILSSDDHLRALKHLSQDFPKYSAALARKVEVSSSVKAKANDLLASGPFPPAFYVNGKSFSGNLDAFSYVLKTISLIADC